MRQLESWGWSGGGASAEKSVGWRAPFWVRIVAGVLGSYGPAVIALAGFSTAAPWIGAHASEAFLVLALYLVFGAPVVWTRIDRRLGGRFDPTRPTPSPWGLF